MGGPPLRLGTAVNGRPQPRGSVGLRPTPRATAWPGELAAAPSGYQSIPWGWSDCASGTVLAWSCLREAAGTGFSEWPAPLYAEPMAGPRFKEPIEPMTLGNTTPRATARRSRACYPASSAGRPEIAVVSR